MGILTSNQRRWTRWAAGVLAAGAALGGAVWGFYTSSWAETAEVASAPEDRDPTQLPQTSTTAFLRAYAALQAGQAQSALKDLQGLEESLPVLREEIWKLRAQAYEQLQDKETAQGIWWLWKRFWRKPLMKSTAAARWIFVAKCGGCASGMGP